MATSAAPFYIQEVRKVRALASPVRAAIIDVLDVLGPATVVQVAESLGYPPDGLYYYFSLLQRNGLVGRADPERDRSASRFQLPGHPATLRYRLDDTRQQVATTSHRNGTPSSQPVSRGDPRAVRTGHPGRREARLHEFTSVLAPVVSMGRRALKTISLRRSR